MPARSPHAVPGAAPRRWAHTVYGAVVASLVCAGSVLARESGTPLDAVLPIPLTWEEGSPGRAPARDDADLVPHALPALTRERLVAAFAAFDRAPVLVDDGASPAMRALIDVKENEARRLGEIRADEEARRVDLIRASLELRLENRR